MNTNHPDRPSVKNKKICDAITKTNPIIVKTVKAVFLASEEQVLAIIYVDAALETVNTAIPFITLVFIKILPLFVLKNFINDLIFKLFGFFSFNVIFAANFLP